MQSDQRLWWSSGLSRTKLCGKCGQRKTLPQFPRDRSRPDGHWHCCKECNGKRLRLLRLAESRRKKWEIMFLPAPANPRRRLEGLKSYRKKRKSKNRGERFSNLPPLIRCFAEQLYINYLHKHRGPRLTQQKRALLKACATSNAWRVGNSFWGRRLRRLKGWRHQRLSELRAELSPSTAEQGYSGGGWTQTSRLKGV